MEGGDGEIVCDGDGDDDDNDDNGRNAVYVRECVWICIQHQINESAQTLLKSQEVFFHIAFERKREMLCQNKWFAFDGAAGDGDVGSCCRHRHHRCLRYIIT